MALYDARDPTHARGRRGGEECLLRLQPKRQQQQHWLVVLQGHSDWRRELWHTLFVEAAGRARLPLQHCVLHSLALQ